MRFYKSGEFAQMLGVTSATLRNWDFKGILKPHHKTDTGYRYYSEEQLQKFFEKSCEDDK